VSQAKVKPAVAKYEANDEVEWLGELNKE
jgi:hypothetical protein